MLRPTLFAALAGLALPAFVEAAELNLYSARHYDTDLALYEQFTDATGIEINLIEGSSDEIIERIVREGADSPADVLITVDAGRLWRADNAGLFQPVESAVLQARIPEHLRHPQGYWFGITKRARVIAYDTRLGRPEGLDTYEDLADPAHEGQICVRSSSNIYNLSLIASIIAANGVAATEAWAGGIVDNMARPPQGGDTVQLRALAAGVCPLAISNTYYLGRLMASDDPADQAVASVIGVIYPNQDGRGTHVNLSGAGVLANAPNPDNAVKFLEFMVSDAAQAAFAGANHEFSVVEGLAVDTPLNRFGPFVEDEIDPRLLGEFQAEALRLTDRAGWQ